MTILLSNDDGYKAKGIRILEKALSGKGHRVLVAAPETEQSGKSHGMTIYTSLKVRKTGKDHYAIGGTPTDCVIYSIRGDFFGVMPDLVIGGINHGYNQSVDIIYSGTCAVARQASLYGIPAIAVSAEYGDEGLLETTAAFVADNLACFVSLIREFTFLNINVPLSFNGKGKAAGIGLCDYHDHVVDMGDDGESQELQLRGGGVTHPEFKIEMLPTDYAVCDAGFASISLVDDLPHVSRHMGDILV